MERYSAQELSAATGLPAHTLTYWAKTGLLPPSAGSAYTARDMALGLVLAEVVRLGATGALLALLAARLDGDPVSWPEHLWMTHAGVLLEEDSAPSTWAIHPRRIMVSAAPNLMLALAS